MTHHMNLNHEPFCQIRDGSKTIELRLYDEKRRAISVGDHIVFSNVSDPSALITVRVLALHRFASFAELYAALPLERCGYREDELATADPRDMEAYYSPERQALYGVLGIEIELEEQTA